MRQLLVFLVGSCYIVLSFLSFNGPDTKDGKCDLTILRDSIDIEMWQKDSLGCEGYRRQMGVTFSRMEDQLKGLSKFCIEKALGPPSFHAGFYATGGGPACRIKDVNRSFYSDSLDTEYYPTTSMWIIFDDEDRFKEVQFYVH